MADLVQDTFLELHRARRTCQPGRPVRARAFGIARHVLPRHRDGERRRARHEASQLPIHTVALEGVSADAELFDADVREVNLALQALSPGTRDAWLVHHVEGRGFGEIATRMGIATTAARLRASSATAAIRRALGFEGGRAMAAIPGNRSAAGWIRLAAAAAASAALFVAITYATHAALPTATPDGAWLRYARECIGMALLFALPSVALVALLVARALPDRPALVGATCGFGIDLMTDAGCVCSAGCPNPHTCWSPTAARCCSAPAAARSWRS